MTKLAFPYIKLSSFPNNFNIHQFNIGQDFNHGPIMGLVGSMGMTKIVKCPEWKQFFSIEVEEKFLYLLYLLLLLL